jgi:hypothetical protein
LDNKTVVGDLTKDDAPYCLSTFGLPQLYFNQLQVMTRHISHAALAAIRKAITRPKFNCWHLQQQLNRNGWQDIESIQLDNYWKKNMFRPPCIGPIYASFLFLVWIYSINPHENNQEKLRGVCDGSTQRSQIMVHCDMYAPMPHQIDFCIQMSLEVNLSMYL